MRDIAATTRAQREIIKSLKTNLQRDPNIVYFPGQQIHFQSENKKETDPTWRGPATVVYA